MRYYNKIKKRGTVFSPPPDLSKELILTKKEQLLQNTKRTTPINHIDILRVEIK